MNLESKIVTIKVGDTDMEVLTDSNGNYYLNQSQVAEVIEVPQPLVHDFLEVERESLTLLIKDYKLMRQRDDIIPIEFAAAFWIEQGVAKGNKKATSLAINTMLGVLELKCVAKRTNVNSRD